MKDKVLGKFFYSGFQAIGFQVLGVVFFYLISINLSKENFGFISWANALCAFLTSLLSGGMEQVMIRRIAVSKTSDWAAAAYLLHSFISSLIVLLALILLRFLFRDSNTFYFLPFFFIAQAVIYIAAPLKQYLNAKEKFAPYGVIAVLSNGGRILSALYFIKNNAMSVSNMLAILIIFAILEFLGLFFYIISSPDLKFSFTFRIRAYKKLLKESLPQYFAVIFDSSLSRMDWILLGVISTRVITADYSFAYRAYEISKLPLSVIGPILLPRFARMLVHDRHFSHQRKLDIGHLFVMELFVSTGMIILLNIVWAPGISELTNGKYGYSNSVEFLILTFCIPIQFFINILWTLCFAGKKYHAVTAVIIASAALNIILNLILIPLYAGKGAAVAFFITCIVQVAGYYRVVKKNFLSFPLKYLFIFYFLGLGICFGSGFIPATTPLKALFALCFYIFTCLILRLVSKQNFSSVKLLLNG